MAQAKDCKTMFGSWKVLKKEKTIKKNGFLMFGFIMKNTKENQISLKLIRNLCILKLFNFNIMEEK